jgi:hypothetical protein
MADISILNDTSIWKVWYRDPGEGNHKLWQKNLPEGVGDLTTLENGQAYYFYRTGAHQFDPGMVIPAMSTAIPEPIVWHDPIAVKVEGSPRYVTESNLNWALTQIARKGLYPILWAAGVKEIQVIERFPPEWRFAIPIDQVFGSYNFERRIIYLVDKMFMPVGVLPASILHEAWHLLLLANGVGFESNKHEWACYQINWLYHILNGDPQSGVDPGLYPNAARLVGQPWL